MLAAMYYMNEQEDFSSAHCWYDQYTAKNIPIGSLMRMPDVR
jgi:hypothetical protein